MLKHIVMWKLKESALGKSNAENAQILKERLENLVGKITEIRSLQVGINVKKSDMAYDAVLVSAFENEEALETYKKHPEHMKVSAFCKEIRESRTFVDFYE